MAGIPQCSTCNTGDILGLNAPGVTHGRVTPHCRPGRILIAGHSLNPTSGWRKNFMLSISFYCIGESPD